MKVKEIYSILNRVSAFELQESWDNSGIQVGSFEQEVEYLHVALELERELLQTLKPNTLVVVHHPLIFSPLKNFEYSNYPAMLMRECILKNITVVAMHTNFDKTHLNNYVAKEVLGLEIFKQDEFVLYAKWAKGFKELVADVTKKLQLHAPKLVSSKKPIKTIAFCTGSGASLLSGIEADCFLTGDIKYHDAMLAKAQNTAMIDIGHFESEQFFGNILAKELKNFGLQAIISQSINPFSYE